MLRFSDRSNTCLYKKIDFVVVMAKQVAADALSRRFDQKHMNQLSVEYLEY